MHDRMSDYDAEQTAFGASVHGMSGVARISREAFVKATLIR